MSGSEAGSRSTRATLLAPAKLNLGLRVTARRSDGYHELDGLFVPLDLGDRIDLEVCEGRPRAVTLAVETAPGVPGDAPAGAANLAARAAAAFLEAARLDAAVRIRLQKHIPSPGGLGGGSSDAGSVLVALARLLPGAVGKAELARLALGLGADVPFFLGPDGCGPVPARVRGIGEEIRPVEGVPSLVVGLVHPRAPLETSRVYAEFDAHEGAAASLTGPGRAPTMPALQGQAGEEDPAGPDRWRSAAWLSQLLVNDLEPAARRLCPAIGELRDALLASGAVAVGLSGSGPTTFGIFSDAPAASEALAGARVRAAPSTAAAAAPWTGVARTLRSGTRD